MSAPVVDRFADDVFRLPFALAPGPRIAGRNGPELTAHALKDWCR